MNGTAAGMDLLLHVSDPVLIARSDGTICFANDAVHVLAGWSRTMIGSPVRAVIRDWTFDQGSGRSTANVRSIVERADGLPLLVDLQMSSWRFRGAVFIGAVIRDRTDHDLAIRKLTQQQDETATALAEARVAKKRLEQVVEMLPQAVCVFDAEDRYVLWNRLYAELYPETAGTLRVGVPFVDVLRASLASGESPELVGADAERWLTERLAKHAKPASREEQALRGGRWVLHDDRRLADGGAIGMRIDITDLKRREASFRLLFQSNPVPMLLFEAGTLRLVDANDSATALYGLTRDAFLRMTIPDLHLDIEREAARQTFGCLVDAYDGRAIWHHQTSRGEVDVLIFVRASSHQDRPCFLAAIIDVSDRIRAEAQIAHIAHHDPVTGLANRIRFRATAEAVLAAASAYGEPRVVIHCLDLDGFKPVNDTHGHSIGDALLRMVGERLQAAVRHGDLVARVGGDEFAVIQAGGSDEAEMVARRLLSCLNASFRIGEIDIRVGASVGFAVAPRDGADLDQLLVAADAALYAAKAAGRGVWRSASGHELHCATRARCV